MNAQPPDLLTHLASTPTRIARAVDGLSDAELRANAPGEDWSVADVFAHIRASDDVLAYRVYLLLVRDDQPILLSLDERRWAEVVGYAEAEFHTSLQLFTLRRAELVNMLRRAAPENWQRSGTHEQLGPISVLDVAAKIADHEEEHCAQIETLRGSSRVNVHSREVSSTDIPDSDREKVKQIIEGLRNRIGPRIGMYIGDKDPWFLTLFFHGFNEAARILGLSYHGSTCEKVISERGWKVNSYGEFREMQERGMDNDAIIQEMIAIEVETWKRSYNIAD